MNALETLKDMWQKRCVNEPSWFTDNYHNVAASRITYESHNVNNKPYWYGEVDDSCTTGDGDIVNLEGSLYESPSEARERAFEILVLADLAELEKNND